MKKVVAFAVALISVSKLTEIKANAWFKRTHIHIINEAFEVLKNDGKLRTITLFKPFLDLILYGGTVPDAKGDCDNGSGLHYYSPLNKFGLPNRQVAGYYPNRFGGFYKSAGTMIEENYTMALIHWQNKRFNLASVSLGRVLHFISDICCVPHTTSRVCTGNPNNRHTAFEQYANKSCHQHKAQSAISTYEEYANLSIGQIANRLAEASSGFYDELMSGRKIRYENIVRSALPEAQIACAGIIVKFRKDIKKKILIDEKRYYQIMNMTSKMCLHNDGNVGPEIEGFRIKLNLDGTLGFENSAGDEVELSGKYKDFKLTCVDWENSIYRITCSKKFTRAFYEIPFLKRVIPAIYKPSNNSFQWKISELNT
ncbi:MAG: hypothetical protein GX896_04715 [Clostridiales bacterium]|nr:hypothetical protein [Clostridiales bacterium]